MSAGGVFSQKERKSRKSHKHGEGGKWGAGSGNARYC